VQQFLVRAVKWYQYQREGYPSPCRFEPSCSNYSLEALETFGAFKGTLLTIRRLLRCRPFGPSGFDPIPEKR
jgi:putative membrane protein insertion efficiency factor